MKLSPESWLPLLAGLVLFSAPIRVMADLVQIDSIITTFHGGSNEELRQSINGADINRSGWFVSPHTDQPQTAIFHASKPVDTAAMDITLCFLSGRQYSYPGEFAISVTADLQPSLAGKWERLLPGRINATGPELTMGADGHFRTQGIAADAVFQFTARPGVGPVTGFRLEVFPSCPVKGRKAPQVSARADGDFVLTQFRVEADTPRTTNIALGRPVKASDPVRFPAENLTDGLPGTFSHPLRPDLGSAFYFEIDLGTVRQLDHIALRNRGDGNSPDRISHVVIRLYDEAPDTGVVPVWTGRDRADGSHPGIGEVDVIHAADGAGKFAGRWLRLSSESPISFSPQFAEVEVYEQLVLQLISVRADGIALSPGPEIPIPAGSRWLTVTMRLEPAGLPKEVAFRWRLRGFQTDWQLAPGLVAEGTCPPPGDYVLESQARHSDGEWNAATLTVPIHVGAYFWQRRDFHFLVIALTVLGFAWMVWRITRLRWARRMSALEANAALNEERTRIARDMHDEVGARLSQLAILQDILAREPTLPAEVRQRLQQLAQTARRVIASLDEVVWAVNPRNDTLSSLAGYLEQCSTGYLGPVEIACRLDSPFEWPLIEVRAQVRHNLVLAFREALQNILKHARATEVTLKLRLESAAFVILLSDNGTGLPDVPAGDGKDGLGNMRARLAAIGGTCRIWPRDGGGTQVEMRIHLEEASDGIHPQ